MRYSVRKYNEKNEMVEKDYYYDNSKCQMESWVNYFNYESEKTNEKIEVKSRII